MRQIMVQLYICLMLLTSCGVTPSSPSSKLTIHVLYPTPGTQITMGQSLKILIEVKDNEGIPIPNAKVTLTFIDPNGEAIGTRPATYGEGEVYRSQAWPLPHRQKAGVWTFEVEAVTAQSRGNLSGTFLVENSISETLLEKYGFWIEAPTLRSILPSLVAERGDAQNGYIRWGGALPSMHVLPENWIEIHWRSGDFKMRYPDDARRFMLEELGDFGFAPIREVGLFERFAFNGWDGWRASARGQLYYHDIEWVVFYAAEVDKTYAIGTTVVQPPAGIKPHEILRESFMIEAGHDARGEAPQPLLVFLPGPQLTEPALGERFLGKDQTITLKWLPVKVLSEADYYLVTVDFSYQEGGSLYRFATRETQYTLPQWMYAKPNCGVFNWRVRLMKQTGVDAEGEPIGEPLSYNSFYWYVQWLYPAGEPKPFSPACPNALT